MADYLGLCLNLKGGQLSQWANYNFNSMTKIGNQYVGAGENGLMQLNTGDDDAGSAIEAFFELVTSDWGIPGQKRVRSWYVGYEADGDLMLTVKDDDGNERAYLLEPNHSDNQQHGAKVWGARDGKGRYWMVRIDNVNGSDFSIDDIKILPIVLNSKPSGA
jgi:hypothetical protein